MEPTSEPAASDQGEDIEIGVGIAEDLADTPVHWQATEYLHREKDARWFGLFVLVVVGLLIISIWLMDSWTFAALIVVMAAALIVYIKRPPAVINYTLSRKGLYINDTLRVFDEFKSFGVLRDEGEYSIILIPRKRFQPALTVYFPEASGEEIVDMFGARLPMHEPHLDFMDQIVRRLRI